MRIRYENYGGAHPFEKEGKAESFMLMNNAGGYLFLGIIPVSRYQGVYFHEKDMYKAVEWVGSREIPQKIVLKKWCVEKDFGKYIERFFMPYGYDGFVFETTKGEFEFVLDCRKSYDNSEFGRYYQVEHREDMLIITYTKKKDSRNSDTQKSPYCCLQAVDKDFSGRPTPKKMPLPLGRGVGHKEKYTMYIVLRGKRLGYEKHGEWIKHSYDYDKRRGSEPHERHVFKIGNIHCEEIAVAYGLDKDKTLEAAKALLDYKEKLVQKQKKLVDENHISGVVKNKEVRAGYECALSALDGLSRNGRIFAGFPWFFQFWSRDELISLGGFQGDWYNIIMNYLENIGIDGRIPNRVPSTDLGSADSIGWLFLRSEKLLEKMKGRKKDAILGELHHSLALLEKFRTVDGLVKNDSLETWMDTKWSGDTREGYRIEIQALRLRMYSVMAKHLRGDYAEKERKLKALVRRKFWNGKILADGLDDWTVRCNVFLAAYIYPSLLSKKEWTICFKTVLKKLWLKWGGISTIDKKNKLFCSEHTGENNKSYHRGDSWYFVNNIAAIVMARINKGEFSRYVYKILEGSTHEILYSGAAGCAAEISSASSLSSFGCWNQAWSDSTYIEMVEELRKLGVI